MVKGTPSFGKHRKTLHIRCRRCGSRSYRKDKGYCSKCGFGRSKKLRKYKWRRKKV
ncbi:MAG: 50S ribosomal protein L37e [Candidatus Aenigmarchaeota archaeon]|nr:50S ribosomal protein L37e [Candidatus Aenigmarchaeota archaeon]